MGLNYNSYLEKNSMFQYRYNFRAKTAISLAIAEALQRKTDNIPGVGTSLILLGIMAEGEGLGYRVLSSKGITLKGVEYGARNMVDGIAVWQVAGIFGYSYGADRALDFAIDAADRLGHKFIGTEHLLLGIIDEIRVSKAENGPRGGAVRVLEKLGILDFKGLEEEILNLL
jgi:ATP-dependent Clp protease ATP-binding subunit ClpC